MLYLLDVDGTIAERYTLGILLGVREWFENFDWTEDRVAFVTNQGGVGLRYWMEEDGFGDPSKYPTRQQVIDRLRGIERALIPPTQKNRARTYVAFAYQNKQGKWGPVPKEEKIFQEWKTTWRKPQAGMLLQAMQDADMSPDDTVMIGDSGDDKQAAKAAGVKFILASDFFATKYE